MDLLNWVSLCHQGTVRRGGSARRRTPGCKSQAATSPVPRPANSTSLNSSSSILPGPYNSWPCRSSQAARSVSSHEKLTLSKNLELRTCTFTSAVKSSYSHSSATAKQLWVCVYVYAGGRRQRRSAFLKLASQLCPQLVLAFPSTAATCMQAPVGIALWIFTCCKNPVADSSTFSPSISPSCTFPCTACTHQSQFCPISLITCVSCASASSPPDVKFHQIPRCQIWNFIRKRDS